VGNPLSGGTVVVKKRVGGKKKEKENIAGSILGPTKQKSSPSPINGG